MKMIKCHGISMEKLLQNNDIIILNETHNIKVFDIIVFYYKGNLFCHRCIFKLGNYVLEFGENSKLPNWIHINCILGNCIGIIRKNSYYKFNKFTLKYYLFLLLILIFKFFSFQIHLFRGNLYIKIYNCLYKRLKKFQFEYLIPANSLEISNSLNKIEKELNSNDNHKH